MFPGDSIEKGNMNSQNATSKTLLSPEGAINEVDIDSKATFSKTLLSQGGGIVKDDLTSQGAFSKTPLIPGAVTLRPILPEPPSPYEPLSLLNLPPSPYTASLLRVLLSLDPPSPLEVPHSLQPVPSHQNSRERSSPPGRTP